MIRQVTAVGAALGAFGFSAPAMAANCADRDTVVERLASHYEESFTAGGLQTVQNKQTLVEVWSSEETGTFTVILTTPEGMACIVATGTDWYQAHLLAEPEGTES